MGKKKFNGVLFDDSFALNEENEVLVSPNKIKIDPELEYLIPPLSEEELKGLEESLLAEGCREPLILWQSGKDYILVDGHNRYRLCQKHNIDFNTKFKSFVDKAEVKDWMLSNQMSRRNLSPLQMSYLRGLRYENEKMGIGRQKGTENKTGQNDQIKKLTSKKLSDEYGVGEKTIRRDARFAIGLNKLAGSNQSLRWSILNGRVQAKKNTISELVDKDEEFLRLLQEKLPEAGSLEQAVNLAASTTGEENGTSSVTEAGPLPEIKKRLSLLSNRAVKMDKSDPKRKEVVKELRQVFKEFLKGLDKV